MPYTDGRLESRLCSGEENGATPSRYLPYLPPASRRWPDWAVIEVRRAIVAVTVTTEGSLFACPAQTPGVGHKNSSASAKQKTPLDIGARGSQPSLAKLGD